MTRLGSLAFAFAVLTPAGAVRAQSGAGRIAYVNTPAILQSMPDYSRADSIYKGYYNLYQVQVAKLQGLVDSAGSAYQESSAMLTPTNRAAKLKALQKLQDSVSAQVDSLQAKSQAQEQQLLGPIEDRVRGVLEGLRAEGNYDYIIDINALGSAVLAANKALDLTQKAIARLSGSSGGTGHE